MNMEDTVVWISINISAGVDMNAKIIDLLLWKQCNFDGRQYGRSIEFEDSLFSAFANDGRWV